MSIRNILRYRISMTTLSPFSHSNRKMTSARVKAYKATWLKAQLKKEHNHYNQKLLVVVERYYHHEMWKLERIDQGDS